ncbi:hypothetical protein AW734_13005 [Pantoea ananatis]|nr:hypothetical protein AW734_13005 [Pantoea ananatis]
MTARIAAQAMRAVKLLLALRLFFACHLTVPLSSPTCLAGLGMSALPCARQGETDATTRCEKKVMNALYHAISLGAMV